MVRLQRFNATGTTCPVCGHESVFDGKCEMDNCEEMDHMKVVIDDQLQGYRESFAGYSTQDLFHEILSLSKGDQWDGMSSKNNDADLAAAMKIFGERMQAAGIEWDGKPTQEEVNQQLETDKLLLGYMIYTVDDKGNKTRLDPTKTFFT